MRLLFVICFVFFTLTRCGATLYCSVHLRSTSRVRYLSVCSDLIPRKLSSTYTGSVQYPVAPIKCMPTSNAA